MARATRGGRGLLVEGRLVSDTYIRAAENYVQAMRTGEGSAARQATAFLADDVVLVAGGERIAGARRSPSASPGSGR